MGIGWSTLDGIAIDGEDGDVGMVVVVVVVVGCFVVQRLDWGLCGETGSSSLGKILGKRESPLLTGLHAVPY